jgi:hypothetical protein
MMQDTPGVRKLFSVGSGGQAELPWSWLSRLKSRYHCGMGTFRWMSLYTVHSAGLHVTRAAARVGSPAAQRPSPVGQP